MANKSILIISDLHYPYNHPDVIDFLKALDKKYKFDKIISVGDELDYHAISFHDSDPDLMSAGDELQTSINRMKPLYKLFPDMDLVESNHGSLVYRKQKAHGLPRSVIKSYRDILEAPKTWRWHDDLLIKTNTGDNVYICHGKSADVLKLSMSMGMSCIQGHYHEKFEIRYWGNKLGLYFGMIVGCLIENSSLAFAYNKLNLKRPVIGCGGIINGQPRLFPMLLNKNGRWTKDVP
ncbi:MAG TPA: metallophosphoesterase [Allocoleopsis sp.]